MAHDHQKQSGFTLIEVVVTFVILATAMTIILQHLSVVLNYVRIQKEQSVIVTKLLNAVETMQVIDLPQEPETASQTALFLSPELFWRQRFQDTLPDNIAVYNFTHTTENVPVTSAFSPFQRFQPVLQEELRYKVNLVLPGLKPQ